MSKAVMISIQPKWCELIASGEKTVEVRKTKPKLETPFKCYIYETRAKSDRPIMLDFGVLDYHGRGKVIGEFVCDCISEYECEFHDGICMYYEEISKVYIDEDGDKFSVIETANDEEYPDSCELLISAAMTFQQIKDYANWDGFGKLYGWHISNLVIYDTPKELSEFIKPCIYGDDGEGEVSCFECEKSGFAPDLHIDCYNILTRPPQSWCYVEQLRE